MKLLAMEFTSEHIHIFQVDSQPGMTRVEKALHLDMPQNSYVDGMLINNDQSISELIANKLKEEKIKERKVVVTISGVNCMTEEFSIPEAKQKIMDGMVEQELQKRRKLNNAYIFDYIVLGPDPIKSGYINISAVLCPKALVNNYYDTLRKAGLSPLALDLTKHAMEFIAERSCFTGANEISVLTYINKDEVHFIYCGRNEEPYYRRASIKHDNGIEESMFILSANNKFNFATDDNENIIETLIENITKLTRFHSQRHPDIPISTIYVYGEHDDINMLCDRVSNAVGITARPYTIVSSISGMQQRTTEPVRGCVNVLGTVMALYAGKNRNFEFFEKLKETNKKAGNDLFWIPSIIAVFLALLVLVSYYFVNKSNVQRQAEIDEMDAYIYGGNNLEDYYLYENYLDNIDMCYDYNTRTDNLKLAIEGLDRFDSDVVEIIKKSVIEGVEIQSFNFSHGEVYISCFGDTQTSAADFARELAKLDGFTDVTYSGFVATVDTTGEMTYSFSVVLVLEDNSVVPVIEEDIEEGVEEND